MIKPVHILIAENQYIHGLHSKPTGKISQDRSPFLIIMLHGFPGNKENHGCIFENLNDVTNNKNYHTLRFDFRGCGQSDGREEDFTLESASKDLSCVLDWAKIRGYKHFIFIGEGLGASIALMNAPKQALCYIFLWPMLNLPLIAENIFKSDEIKEEWRESGYASIGEHHVGLSFIEELKETDITEPVKNLRRPMLILHGSRDQISPISQLDMIRTYAGKQRIEITSFQDGEHGLPQPNYRKAIFYHIMQFVEKYT